MLPPSPPRTRPGIGAVTPGTANNRRPVGALGLHAGPEPLGRHRRERLWPLAVRPLVLAADDRHHQRPSGQRILWQRAAGNRRCGPTARPLRWAWKPSTTPPWSTAHAIPTWTCRRPTVRFRILNAANDRFFNLHIYVADPTVVTSDGRTNTEVKMVPALTTPGFPAGLVDRRPRRRRAGPGHDGPVLDPDRHRGRLPARAGGDPAPADQLEHERDRLQLRQRHGPLAAPGLRRTRRRARGLLASTPARP